MATETKAYGAHSAAEALGPLTIQRRVPTAQDVSVDIMYCGICHSDVHTIRDEWGPAQRPCVPGHEIVGKVSAVGEGVTKYKIGDVVGVGCMVGSCRTCSSCSDGTEQYCVGTGFVGTYNGKSEKEPAGFTQGGYSQRIVVDQHFVFKVTHPTEQLPAVAPLLCAGITVWSPLKHWGAGPGKKVGIVGLGGLGHMGIKLARALSAHTVAFTTSASKVDSALALGAHEVVIHTDKDAMAKHAGSLDLIINTVAAPHVLDVFVGTLRKDGTMVLVGAPSSPHPSPQVFPLIFARRSIAGSLIGGVKETQEMLDFCAEKGITADIELIKAQDINTAYERMLKSDVKYRFVIDNSTM